LPKIKAPAFAQSCDRLRLAALKKMRRQLTARFGLKAVYMKNIFNANGDAKQRGATFRLRIPRQQRLRLTTQAGKPLWFRQKSVDHSLALRETLLQLGQVIEKGQLSQTQGVGQGKEGLGRLKRLHHK
jgi:hypothetical protein